MAYSTHNVATFQSSHGSELNSIDVEPHITSYHDRYGLSINLCTPLIKKEYII